MSLLEAILSDTGEAIEKDLSLVPLRVINESVFRHHFVVSAISRNEGIECQVEWKRIDLIMQVSGFTYAVEFKFYGDGVAYSLDGRRKWKKGGPGSKNRKEFFSCVEKLKNLEQKDYIKNESEHLSGKFLVLGYILPTYEESYKDIDYPEELKEAVEYESEGPTVVSKNQESIATKLIKVL